MLRFEELTKSYCTAHNQVHALKSVQGHIEKGTTVALCGPSGSGKSTLLNICGLLDPQYQGKIYLDNELVPHNKKALTQLRREKIGFIFHSFKLFNFFGNSSASWRIIIILCIKGLFIMLFS